MMFGDSLTGRVRCLLGASAGVGESGFVPVQLYQMLTERYTGQQFDVWNEGRQGEWAIQGQLRFAATARSHRAEVIIIMEGANDLSGRGERGMQPALEGLDNMLRDARAQGASVVLASLPPERPPLGVDRRLVDDFNAGVKRLAERQRVMFVDVNAEFGTDGSLISPDGLHPSTAGYRKIAEIFFDTIRRTFEVAPTT